MPQEKDVYIKKTAVTNNENYTFIFARIIERIAA